MNRFSTPMMPVFIMPLLSALCHYSVVLISYSFKVTRGILCDSDIMFTSQIK